MFFRRWFRLSSRLSFAISLLVSVVLLIIGNLTKIPVFALIGYCVMSVLFLLAGFNLAVLRHTASLTGNDENIAWDEAPGELKALTIVIGIGFLLAGLFVIFAYVL